LSFPRFGGSDVSIPPPSLSSCSSTGFSFLEVVRAVSSLSIITRYQVFFPPAPPFPLGLPQVSSLSFLELFILCDLRGPKGRALPKSFPPAHSPGRHPAAYSMAGLTSLRWLRTNCSPAPFPFPRKSALPSGVVLIGPPLTFSGIDPAIASDLSLPMDTCYFCRAVSFA